MIHDEKEPLVSIYILTYNSAQYITETLNSAKNQTYENIELIISDDCSTDNTVQECTEWLRVNETRFKRVKIITATHNTGIVFNINRAIKACTGEWVKGIAGDDILLENCISDNMHYIHLNPSSQIVFSKMIHFNDVYSTQNIISTVTLDEQLSKFFSMSIKEQLREVIERNYLPAPSVFYKKSLVTSLGFFDERFGYEDWPMWITMLEHNIEFHYFEKATIAYRHHANSLSNHKGIIINEKQIVWKKEISEEMCFKYFSKWRKQVERIQYSFFIHFSRSKFNNDTKFNHLMFRIINALIERLK